VLGIEAQVHVRQTIETADQQTGADQEHHPQGCFRNHQPRAQTVVAGTGRRTAPALAHRLRQIGLRNLQGWHQTEKNAGSDGKPDGKKQNPIIDADLRRPSATSIFGLQNERGLVDLLLGQANVEDVVRFNPKGGYWTLGAGDKSPSPTDLLSSERMKTIVAGFRQAYDLVIIDTPPAVPVVDPAVVSHLTDKIIFVVRWGATARELVRDCVNQLSRQRKIAGIAFNQVYDRKARKYGKHAYSYYYVSRYKNYYGT